MANTKILGLLGEVADSFEHSLAAINQHLYTTERLTKDLKHFESEVSRQIERDGKVIESGVQMLIGQAKELLKLCRTNATADYVPYCLAAVDYLVNADDAIPDFLEYDGFDDDCAVFECVIRSFNLPVKRARGAA